MWRTVSFVQRIELEYRGNLFNQAIVLGDVDNDKGHELVVGNVDGDLSIYKGRSPTPWRRCRDLGMITCVGIGDIYNKGKNVLLALTAEGWCYIFDIKPSSDTKEPENEGDVTLTSSFTQLLPANGKVLLICDIDGDGKTELVVGYSDRVVRCFKWLQTQDEGTEHTVDKLMQIGKWQLNRQIGSLTLNLTPEGKPELLVAQPGGAYAILLLRDSAKTDIPKQGSDLDLVSLVETTETFKEEHPGHGRTRNSNIDTEIVGGIAKQTKQGKDTYCAICTLDGTLLLVENKEILWSLQVDHQLFSLAKLDVTGNGKDEVVCCSWDGQTYIVNHNKAVVRYQFESDVSAFTAGRYAVDGTDNNPCFVYTTFNNKIYLYYNISLPQVESTNLIEVMNKSEKTHELLEKLGLQDADHGQLRELYRWLLYGWPIWSKKNQSVSSSNKS